LDRGFRNQSTDSLELVQTSSNRLSKVLNNRSDSREGITELRSSALSPFEMDYLHPHFLVFGIAQTLKTINFKPTLNSGVNFAIKVETLHINSA
jgi:hypothetical protein